MQQRSDVDLLNPDEIAGVMQRGAKGAMQRSGVSQSAFAAQIKMDPAALSRCLPRGLTRQVAVALDELVREPVEGFTFAEWRDLYTVALDRAGDRHERSLGRTVVDLWRCPTAPPAHLLAREPAVTGANLCFSLFTVVSCPDATRVAEEYIRGVDAIRGVAIYSLKGSYDLLVRYWLAEEKDAVEVHRGLLRELDKAGEFDSTGTKSGLDEFRAEVHVVADRWAVPGTSMLEQLVNNERIQFRRYVFTSSDSERLRLERSFILVRVPLVEYQFGRWPRQLRAVFPAIEQYGNLIEAVSVNAPVSGSTLGLVMIELLSTCGQRGAISRLNRELETHFALVQAQKSNLSCYDYYESTLDPVVEPS